MESGIETFRHDNDLVNQDSKILNMKRLLHTAIANGASDLLITSGSKPSLRLDGDLKPLDTEPLTPSDTKRLLFSLLNAKQRETFEEQREIDFALSINISRTKGGKTENSIPYRFRINGFFQRGNVAIAVRVIPKKIPRPEELGLPKVLLDIAKKSQGLILVTGPTGHGKSTTLASMINIVNENRACHIITIEDPIEYVHANKKAVVEQREVYADTLSFSNALKYVLRQDPDVILVGEMRDPETIAAALTAAETGHLVMATLHTNSAAKSIERIIDTFPAHQQNQIRIQLSGSLLGIFSQRLIPRRDGNGRVAAFEVMINTNAVQNIIRENKTHLAPSVIETGAKVGMINMDKALKELYERNIISRAEVKKLSTSNDQVL
jgi:twitching motility protein PilT